MNEVTEGPGNQHSDDPLRIAYHALTGDDPQIKSAKQHLWRQLWARDNVKALIDKCAEMPGIIKYLHLALPEDDVELLEQMKSVAERSGDSPCAFFIIGLVNERLERYRKTKLDSGRQQAVVDRLEKNLSSAGTSRYRENYNGYVCAGVKRLKGEWLGGTPDLPGEKAQLPPDTRCELIVWMQPDQPEGAWSDSVLIETGVDEDTVNFGVEVDCATLQFPFGRKAFRRFHRHERSGSVSFDFFTLKKKSEHLVCVHVFQYVSFVKSLMVVFKVAR